MGAACEAIAMSMVGFSYMGWTSSPAAEQMASERADAGLVTAMVPFCIVKAKADGDATLLVKFRAEQSSYSRAHMVMNAGWATLHAAIFGDNALSRASSDQLHTQAAS
jgi:hypothetical protein